MIRRSPLLLIMLCTKSTLRATTHAFRKAKWPQMELEDRCPAAQIVIGHEAVYKHGKKPVKSPLGETIGPGRPTRKAFFVVAWISLSLKMISSLNYVNKNSHCPKFTEPSKAHALNLIELISIISSQHIATIAFSKEEKHGLVFLGFAKEGRYNPPMQ